MRQLIICLFVIMTTICLSFNVADAKRFGGGRSFGVQRSVTSNHSAAAAPAAAARPGNRWLGPLAGLAAGGLLASLFMGHGIGGNLGWIILAVIGAVIVMGIMRRRQNNGNTQNSPFASNQVQQVYRAEQTPAYANMNNFNTSSGYPSSFDKNAFLREVKALFIRLQAAYDTKNLSDLREFTTPQTLAEITLQLQERGDARNQTDVINIDADLIDYEQQSSGDVASVRFSGLIREEENAPATNVSETWHFVKSGPAWLVAGLQQN